MTTRVRFAPSPTGYLHIGGLRTCLYDVLLARQLGGTFILRVEDTDRARLVTGAVEALVGTLSRVDLVPDEGPTLLNNSVVQRGNHGPYVQSERLSIYQSHANRLLEDGNAYYCFCSSDRLESLRKQQEIAKLPTKYDRHCASIGREDASARVAAGEPHVVRMKIPDGETTFHDEIRGDITFNNAEVDDQVLIKTDGFPTYHLAVVVDDHLMEISHVIRGEEWISSTPKHLILYRMFGWEVPKFAHLPLILNPDKSKLSKRQGDVAVEDFLDKGYLPKALINFVALLGFNPRGDQELYSMEELVESFDLSKINKSGAVLDVAKLDWMNAQYIQRTEPGELAELVRPFLESAGKSVGQEMLERVCAIERTRMTRLTDLTDIIDSFVSYPSFDPTTLIWKKADAADAIAQLQGVHDHLSGCDEAVWAEVALLEASIKEYIGAKGLQNGNVLWPTRVALSGRAASPSPFELAWALGRTETLHRLTQAINALTA